MNESPSSAQNSPTHVIDTDVASRFRDIYGALGPGSRWWNDSAWLRFSAQAAVIGTDDPMQTARAIERSAERLYQHAHWYDALASPLNLVVAATLVQTSDTVDAFTADVASTTLLIRKAGFHLGGSLLIKTVLILRVLAGGSPTSMPIVERMHAIYLQMKKKHWWLTGRGEVPVCALLSSLHSGPEEIADTVEGIYKRLHDHHLIAGRDLRTASYMLALRGLPACETTDRFVAIVELLHAKSHPLFHDAYDKIALLSLLNHGPDKILQRLDHMTDMLTDLAPLQFTDVNFTIATDLAYLDLVALDDQMHPLIRSEDLHRMQVLIRLQRAASLVFVNVPAIAPVEGGSTRWQA